MATTEKLAIDGGPPVAKDAFPLGFLGRQNSWCTRLENHFKTLTGREYALAVGGGTAALVGGFVGAGIGEGDEVIIPGYTYIATAAAVLVCGAAPVICEIGETLTMDPADVERKITPRTKAIVPVHMRGLPCDMDRLTQAAQKHGLLLIEDVAQACGGIVQGTSAGVVWRSGMFQPAAVQGDHGG